MAYPAEYVGRTIDCPHCGIQITLGEEAPIPAKASASQKTPWVLVCAALATIIVITATVLGVNRKGTKQAESAETSVPKVEAKQAVAKPPSKLLTIEGSVFLTGNGETAKFGNARVTIIAASEMAEQVKVINEGIERANAVAEEMMPIFKELIPKMEKFVNIKNASDSPVYAIQLAADSKGSYPLIDLTFLTSRTVAPDIHNALLAESKIAHDFWTMVGRATYPEDFLKVQKFFDKRIFENCIKVCARIQTEKNNESYMPYLAKTVREDVQRLAQYQGNKQSKDYLMTVLRANRLMEEAAKCDAQYANVKKFGPLWMDISQTLEKLESVSSRFTNYYNIVFAHIHSLPLTANTIRHSTTDADGRFSMSVEEGEANFYAIATSRKADSRIDDFTVFIKRFASDGASVQRVILANEELALVPSGEEMMELKVKKPILF